MESKRTPPKINIEPENDGLEDDFPFNWVNLRFHANLPGCSDFFGLGDFYVKKCIVWVGHSLFVQRFIFPNDF